MAIHDSRDRDLARVLVRHSVKAKRGELVFIQAVGLDTAGLAEAIVEEVTAVGAAPYVHFVDPEIMRKFLHSVKEPMLKPLSQLEMDQIKRSDCYIGIRGSRNIFELSDVPRQKMDLYNKQVAIPVRNKRVKDSRWVVLRYPNASMAQLSGQPREKFADSYYNVCTLDYARMEKAVRPLAHLMKKTDVVEITGPGTDLRLSIKGIGVIPCTGAHNIPDGECFTAPVKTSVEGTVSFNTPTVWEGTPYENITLRFEKGQIMDAKAADREQTRKLNKVLEQDEGARYVGEFAIAFNPQILHPMRDILFDEKISGSFHMAMGQAYDDASNGNRSGLHWDLVCIQRKDYGGGEISFDGKLIRKDGLFVPKSLQKLNPKELIARKQSGRAKKK